MDGWTLNSLAASAAVLVPELINVMTSCCCLLHGDERIVFADAGYQGASKRPEATGVDWHVAMRPGKRRAQKHTSWGALSEQAEKLKASVRAKVEHPFRVLNCQFGFVKVLATVAWRKTRRSLSRCLPWVTCGWPDAS